MLKEISVNKLSNGLPYTIITYRDAINHICNQAEFQNEVKMIFTPNVHHYYLYATDKEFRSAYDVSYMSLLDGMPLVWLSRIINKDKTEKVSGSDIFIDLFKKGLELNYKIYLLGGASGVAQKVIEKFDVEKRFQERIFFDSPPKGFELDRKIEDEVIMKINKVSPNLLFVALGSPKQEIWICRNRKKLKANIVIGVGGSFDFVAGITPRAPIWIQKISLEWLFRLLMEPKRLWKRYLITNTYFICDNIKILIKTIIYFILKK
ncbi:MAG: WecB/TagA/CpsF family glycosyltransferase [Chitinispirillaceae bacterium]|nr:WecB/TagA/CpsF family glycosyltransferase [Chitinispirillaceae bacterium]